MAWGQDGFVVGALPFALPLDTALYFGIFEGFRVVYSYLLLGEVNNKIFNCICFSLI